MLQPIEILTIKCDKLCFDKWMNWSKREHIFKLNGWYGFVALIDFCSHSINVENTQFKWNLCELIELLYVCVVCICLAIENEIGHFYLKAIKLKDKINSPEKCTDTSLNTIWYWVWLYIFVVFFRRWIETERYFALNSVAYNQLLQSNCN